MKKKMKKLQKARMYIEDQKEEDEHHGHMPTHPTPLPPQKKNTNTLIMHMSSRSWWFIKIGIGLYHE